MKTGSFKTLKLKQGIPTMNLKHTVATCYVLVICLLLGSAVSVVHGADPADNPEILGVILTVETEKKQEIGTKHWAVPETGIKGDFVTIKATLEPSWIPASVIKWTGDGDTVEGAINRIKIPTEKWAETYTVKVEATHKGETVSDEIEITVFGMQYFQGDHFSNEIVVEAGETATVVRGTSGWIKKVNIVPSSVAESETLTHRIEGGGLTLVDAIGVNNEAPGFFAIKADDTATTGSLWFIFEGEDCFELPITAVDLKVDIIQVSADAGSYNIQKDLLEEERYYNICKTKGGTQGDWSDLTWESQIADGSTYSRTNWIYLGDHKEHKWNPRTDKVSDNEWKFDSWLRVTVDTGASDYLTATDSVDFVVHREVEIDASGLWEDDGYDNAWQYMDAMQTGGQYGQSSTYASTVTNTITVGAQYQSGVEAGMKLLKATVGITYSFEWSQSFSVSQGHSLHKTINVPQAPENKWYGIFWRRQITKKKCDVIGWDKYGNSTEAGFVVVRQRPILLGYSENPANSPGEAVGNLPSAD